MSTYTIKEAAERSGFSASALRYYEGIGLVTPATRTDAGYRLYDERSIERLGFIARAKQMGCSLDEITDLLTVWEGQQCGPVQRRFHQLVTDKIGAAQDQIDELTSLVAQLSDAARQLAGPAVDGPCGPGCACAASSTTRPGPSPIEAGASPVGPTITCSLDAAGQATRVDEWRAMLERSTSTTRTATGGVHVTFAAGTDLTSLARLVAAEQSCCAFFTFVITTDSTGTALEVEAPGDADDLLQALFGTVTA